MQNQTAEQTQRQQLQQLAKKGIAPNRAELIQQRLMQQALLDQSQNQMNQRQMQNMSQQVQQLPQEVQTSVRPIWRRQNIVRTERDAFGNIKQIQSGNDPRNFWN
jgi:hypothetical protein